MKKIILIVFVSLVFVGCEKVITPNIEKVKPSIVVEGLISTRPSYNKIYVNYTHIFGGPLYGRPVSGLTVYVIDNNQNRINFNEVENTGTYITNQDEGSTAKIGNTYTLYLETSNGVIYKSTPQTIKECPVTNNIYMNPENQLILTEDAYGDAQEISFPGFTIYAGTKGMYSETNYYLFRWYGYEEHHTAIRYGNNPENTIYRHQPLGNNLCKIICTGNADEFYGKDMRRNKFVFIPNHTFLEYKAIFPDSFVLISNTFDGIIFATEQYSISQDAYIFYKGAEDQLMANNKIFDPVSAQLKGNMTCASDSAQSVYGVFFAADIKCRFDYLYINTRNKVYSRQIDTLPQLWLDTCSWGLPIGWITPPFL